MHSIAARFATEYRQKLSPLPRSLYRVAQVEEVGVASQEMGGVDEVMRGIKLYLDTVGDCGYVLALDDVPYRLLQKGFDVLAVLGWHPIEDDEGVEPHVFDDGTAGVKIWLYRLARPIEVILRDLKAA